jgi:hypothetical protein
VADYYSILSKAVGALEPNTASARQRVYERARSAISAEIEAASPPFEASEIAAVKQGLKSAIERIEVETLPAWIQQPERAECANDCLATADVVTDQVPYRFLDASEIAAAQQGLERAIGRIEAEAIPDFLQQSEYALRTNAFPGAADLPAETEEASPPFDASEIAAARQGLQSAIESFEAEVPDCLRQAEGAGRADDCPDGSEIAAAMQRLEIAIERIKAEAIPDCLQQSEHAARVNDCPATADGPAEIEGVYPPFPLPVIVATGRGPEGTIESTERHAIPDWLRQPEQTVRANEYPTTAANHNDDSPGPLQRLWTRVTGRATGSHTIPSGQDTWLTGLLERASDETSNDERDFAPKHAQTP